MIGKILVPVDGSKQSDKALEFACNLADKYDATLHIQHTIETTSHEHAMSLGFTGYAFRLIEDDIQQVGQKVIEAATKIIDRKYSKVAATEITYGSPTENILQRTKDDDIDMIVMGSRGLSDIGGLLLGSVSHKVSHLADCSCVTVR